MASERFLKAMPYVFEHEGGFNNHVSDKGGATNWGVSLRLLKTLKKDIDGDGDIDYVDIQKLTKENATQIYFDNFWRNLYDRIPYERLAIKMFDTCINTGTVESNILLQRSIAGLGGKIKVDGAIGTETMTELIKHNEFDLCHGYCLAQKNFYDSLIKKDYTQEEFKQGWYNRAAWLPNL
jgi:lysozyme family protein